MHSIACYANSWVCLLSWVAMKQISFSLNDSKLLRESRVCHPQRIIWLVKDMTWQKRGCYEEEGHSVSSYKDELNLELIIPREEYPPGFPKGLTDLSITWKTLKRRASQSITGRVWCVDGEWNPGICLF